ncbi:MAG: TdeIII family type II restriction endonuclease [Candidatus Freyrarchaeum guaymaensis]
MRDETREELRRTILDFAESSLRRVEFSVEELRRAFPFHAIFFPDEALLSFKMQRSLVTRMGMTLYPRLAVIVARDRYREVYRNYQISGMIEANRLSVIDRIVDELRSGRRRPDHVAEMREIFSVAGGGFVEISVIADLYVGDFRPGPLFVEIKSPRPNLDVCAESKKKMFYFQALFRERRPSAYLAFPYNPFVYRERYDHGFTKQVMDMDREVLIGEEMWDKLGGRGTYEELLEIAEEARKIIRRKLKRK